jgi:Icc-related predicted phosphoesterase
MLNPNSKKIDILCLADLHNQQRALLATERFLREYPVDLVLVAGDLTIRTDNALEYIKKFTHLIKGMFKATLFTVHGNNDPQEVIDFLSKEGTDLHLQIKEFAGYYFAGVGGNDQLPPANFDLTSTIFLTHVCPPEILSRNPQFPPELANPPLIHLCGHIHSVEKIVKLNSTKIVKLGPAMFGRGALLKLPSLEVKLINLE